MLNSKKIFFILFISYSKKNLIAEIPHWLDCEEMRNESDAEKKAQNF